MPARDDHPVANNPGPVEAGNEAAPSARPDTVFQVASRVAADILSSRTGVDALEHFADAARNLVGARYAAIGVALPGGSGIDKFVTAGMSPEAVASIPHEPVGAGLLGHLLACETPLRVANVGDHPQSVGFPPGHPPMREFLGVPVRNGSQVLGSLYLTDKPGGFTQEDEFAVAALSLHLAVAIRNLHMIRRQDDLVAGLMAAQEAERRAVAYDLHDGLTQYVMGAWAHLEGFRICRDSEDHENASVELDSALRFLKEAVVESRRLVNGLRTLYLDDLGLAGAVEQLLFEEKDRANWDEVVLAHNLDDERFPETIETALYRFIQEALTNVRKHAGATRVEVRLDSTSPEPSVPRMLQVRITDDGTGFDPELANRSTGKVGLHGMAERVRLLAGSLEIHSESGVGTTVGARIPLPTEQRNDAP